MAKITVDGQSFEVDPKLTIIQAARDNGIEIPHFCWHPALSVAGNCRMCLVEVEKTPKLAIACSTQVSDGMVVQTASSRVLEARRAVMEFLLINHPLDCPICDEAGECKLQDYAYAHSIGSSRFEEDKVHKPKRVALSSLIMLDTERCIMCSRCVRFCDEIAKKPQLTFTQRGDHVELTTFPGEELDNPYSHECDRHLSGRSPHKPRVSVQGKGVGDVGDGDCVSRLCEGMQHEHVGAEQ